MLHSYVVDYLFVCAVLPCAGNAISVSFGPQHCMFTHIMYAEQARHARTKTDPTPKSRAGPGSHQNLVPHLAKFAPTTGLSAALVGSLFVLFSFCGVMTSRQIL